MTCSTRRILAWFTGNVELCNTASTSSSDIFVFLLGSCEVTAAALSFGGRE
jgi:hypothetical protein